MRKNPLAANAGDALLDWFRTAPEAADLLPEARLSMGHRIFTTIGPHGTPEQWAAFLQTPRKKEPHLFRRGAYSPDARRETLRKMTAAEKLADENKRGGKQ